jgi:hypothetical protein
MSGDTTIVAERRTGPPVALTRPSWPAPLFAEALTQLLGRAVSTSEVCDRAVGLGLLRQPAAPHLAQLSPRAASRLLLTAYRLPALVDAGTLAGLTEHIQAGRRVFVVLVEGDTSRLCCVQTIDVDLALAGTDQREPQERFRDAWAATGNAELVAAASWDDLPTTGLLFFGGLRDGDRGYHWNTAECDTDRQGRILRY